MSNKKKTDYDKIKQQGTKNPVQAHKEDDIPEKKKVEKVVSGEVKEVKRGLVSRLVRGVLGPEGMSGVGSYVSEEIIIPAIQNIIVDGVTSAINMVVYRDGSRRPVNRAPRNMGTGYHYGSSRGRVNYTSAYTSSNPPPTSRTVVPKTHTMIEEYFIEDRNDAMAVLSSLVEQAELYGSVSVADYYDMIGVPSVYTDNNFGWIPETIQGATVRPSRNGFVIKFPPVDSIS